MFKFIVISCVFLKTVNLTTLLILYATPNDPSGCSDPSSIIWATCLDYCESNSTCLLAYYSDDACIMCSTVTTITKSDSNLFAIKSDVTSCPADIYTTLTGAGYNATYYSNGTWIVTYTPCNSGYQKFLRPAGYYCLRVFRYTSSVNTTYAKSTCSASSTIISGLNSVAERNWALAQMAAVASSTLPTVKIFIDGTRTTSCKTTSTVSTSNCTWPNGWYFNDTYLNSTSGYTFGTGEPSTRTVSSSVVSCLAAIYSLTNSSVNYTISAFSCSAEYTNGFMCGYALT